METEHDTYAYLTQARRQFASQEFTKPGIPGQTIWRHPFV